jgi:flagellar biogenesis protein FliO
MDRVKSYLLTALLAAAFNAAAQAPDTAHAAPLPGASLPDAGASVIRVFGAFILVIALFLIGVWLFRNWQRVAMQRGGGSRLNVFEVKSLGQRQALYVVGYQQQRMLLASSPAGITLVSHLPDATEAEQAAPPAGANFAQALQQVLGRKK